MPKSLSQRLQIFSGGENSMRPNQSTDLKDQREKRRIINKPERAQKNPAGEQAARSALFRIKQPAQNGRRWPVVHLRPHYSGLIIPALTFVRATHSIFCSPAAFTRFCAAAISDTPSEEVMPIKVGINGFGRIGRNIMRTALDDKDIQFVAVNDVTDAKTLAHLLKYDSILGNLPHNVTHTDDSIAVEGKSFKVFKTKDPGEIDWASVGADIVVESTDLFTKGVDA